MSSPADTPKAFGLLQKPRILLPPTRHIPRDHAEESEHQEGRCKNPEEILECNPTQKRRRKRGDEQCHTQLIGAIPPIEKPL